VNVSEPTATKAARHSTSHAVVLRGAHLRDLLEQQFGAHWRVDGADHIGVSLSTLDRAMKGKESVSAEFMAKTVLALPTTLSEIAEAA
jgi:hypothetical protein